MAKRFSVEAVFKAVDGLTAPVSKMQKRVGKFTRAMARGLNKANRSLKKVTRGLKTAAAASLKFGGAAIAAGLTAFAVALNKVATSADELAKRTRRLDFPIEAFQEWQFVAEQSGLSTESFDKAIEKFAKSVGEARVGTGTLTEILRKANPALLEQVKNADSAAEAFDIYLKALDGTKNQLDKTALATAAFGRTGGKFLNITEQGAEAIAKLRKEMRENGVVTEEQAAAAEAYNDAANTLKRSLFGLLQRVIFPMLPAITKTVRAWRDWIVANKEVIGTNIRGFLLSVKDSALALFEKIKELNSEFSLLDRALELVDLLARGFVFLVDNGKQIAAVVGFIIALNVAIGIASAATKAYTIVTAIFSLGLKLAAGAVRLLSLALSATPLGLLITLFASAAALIVANWEPVSAFFKNLWITLLDGIDAVARVTGAVGSFFGFGGDDNSGDKSTGATGGGGASSQVVSPADRIAKTINEQRTTSTAEVTIKDQTGRAEVTAGKLGAGLSLQPSGSM